jgi:DNA-binding PucR family transcriptional regulator
MRSLAAQVADQSIRSAWDKPLGERVRTTQAEHLIALDKNPIDQVIHSQQRLAIHFSVVPIPQHEFSQALGFYAASKNCSSTKSWIASLT